MNSPRGTFRVFSRESVPHACSEVKEQRKPHEPALKDVLRLTEARSERLHLLEHGIRIHDVEERELGLDLFPLEPEDSLCAQIELVPARLEFGVRWDQIETDGLGLPPG